MRIKLTVNNNNSYKYRRKFINLIIDELKDSEKNINKCLGAEEKTGYIIKINPVALAISMFHDSVSFYISSHDYHFMSDLYNRINNHLKMFLPTEEITIQLDNSIYSLN